MTQKQFDKMWIWIKTNRKICGDYCLAITGIFCGVLMIRHGLSGLINYLELNSRKGTNMDEV